MNPIVGKDARLTLTDGKTFVTLKQVKGAFCDPQPRERGELMNPDPIGALRAVLAENARIPALEAEIAHLRGKRPQEPSEHLPCPFCGGKGFVDSKVAPYSPTTGAVRCRAAVTCGQCSMIGPGAVGATHTESIANAWAAWDRRDGGAR